MKNSNKLGMIFSALCILSIFLPWAESNSSYGGSFGGGSFSSGGISGISLGVGILGLLIGLGSLYSSYKSIKYSWIMGLVMLIDGIYYLLTMNSSAVSSKASYGGYSTSASSSVDPQIGLFVFTISALLLTVFTLKDRKG